MTGCCTSGKCAPPPVVIDSVTNAAESPCSTAKSSKKEPNVATPLLSSFATSITYTVEGMDCAGCASSVAAVLSTLRGVRGHETNFSVSQLTIEYDDTIIGPKEIKGVLQQAGYKCKVVHENSDELLDTLTRKQESEQYKRSFFLSLIFSIPLMIITDVLPFLKHHTALSRKIIPGLFLGDLLAILLTIRLLYIGRRFFVSAFAALRFRTTNIDTLVSVGISTAAFYSVIAMIVAMATKASKRPETFFETAGELVSFILFGRWLESMATGRTADALAALLKLTPKTAVRLEGSNQVTVTVDALRPGDIIITTPGSTFAADGIVISGQGSVDQSMLTGEAMPVHKGIGDHVAAGTVIIDGTIQFKATQLGTDTQLNQIFKLMQDAQSKKVGMQQLADRLAHYFTPIILCLSIITFITWIMVDPTRFARHHLLRAEMGKTMLSIKLAIAVIVISCPCALAVATPAAVMVATGRASKKGILIKGASVIEAMSKVTNIVFDKTKTLTTGKMRIANVDMVPEWMSRNALFWTIVGSAERAIGKAHPIATTIVQHASLRAPLDAQVSDLHSRASRGLSCIVTEETAYAVLIGNASFMLENDVDVPKIETDDTLVYIAIDGQYTASLTLSDTLKDDAKKTIKDLRARGKTIWLLTGDHQAATMAIAQQLEISASHIRANQSPQDKSAFVAALGQSCMVGDGINDAAALSSSTCGISFSSGSEISIDSADIVLLTPSLSTIPIICDITQSTMSRIKRNLLFAVSWNIIGIPFAMGVFLPLGIYIPPVLAGAMMSMTCVSIILSSLL